MGTSWVGGNDIAREGRWVWSDLMKFGYKNWRRGEPNNKGGEDCMEIYSDDGTWNDQACTDKRSFVCKVTYFNGKTSFLLNNMIVFEHQGIR